MPVNEFLWPVRVYYEDTDKAGVVYYANYLKFMERARTEWLRAKGYEQDRLARVEKVLFAVRSLQLDYLKPALFNQALIVSVKLLTMGKASMEFEQKVTNADGNNNLLCTGKVKIACLNATTFRPTPIPKDIYREISGER
jgi:acyl-CoA thioester hydrolase